MRAERCVKLLRRKFSRNIKIGWGDEDEGYGGGDEIDLGPLERRQEG